VNDAKDKRIFKDTLTGKTVARDIFDTPMIEGEFLLHAAGGTSPEMRVLKILEVRNALAWRGGFRGQPREQYTVVSLKVRRATRWRRGDWILQDRHSYIKSLENCIVLTDPKPELIELFKDV
jgi:hypothetical protein